MNPRVRQSSRRNIVLRVDQNIEYPAAFFTDEMLMALDERIEMLRAPQHQHLEFFVGDQFLQITIDCPKTYVRQTFAHFIVDLIRSRVGGSSLIASQTTCSCFVFLGFLSTFDMLRRQILHQRLSRFRFNQRPCLVIRMIDDQLGLFAFDKCLDASPQKMETSRIAPR